MRQMIDTDLERAHIEAGVGSLAAGSVIPFDQRLTCSVRDACNASGLSRAKLYQLLSDGSVSSTTIGRRRLVHVRSLRTLLRDDA